MKTATQLFTNNFTKPKTSINKMILQMSVNNVIYVQYNVIKEFVSRSEH